jgi:hypothetical protein
MTNKIKKTLALFALIATFGLSMAAPAHADWGNPHGWYGGYYHSWHPYGYWHAYGYGYRPGYYGYGPYAPVVVYGAAPVYVAPAPIVPVGINVGFNIR